ncbi:MAG TPA: peptidyl-prolyl cis-trans isomerase [Acidobacteria bacterium]|nr:peptidyl-prolyl cis-trans isomerase [Acidobacteriota bacterium]
MSVRTLTLLAGCCLAVLVTMHAPQAAAQGNPVVVIETSLGNITAELDQANAPLSVANFLEYVESGHYGGTVFHRVIKTFMIQGGGFTADMQQKPVNPPVKNEARNGVSNDKYTLAMARTNVVDSATAQFFINTADNAALNNSGITPAAYGYAVFGRVTEGADVVDKIADVEVGNRGPYQNVPTTAVDILSITVQ